MCLRGVVGVHCESSGSRGWDHRGSGPKQHLLALTHIARIPLE